ncbi:MAG: aminopeptidase P family protein [bacterium]|nr:aminopeptidase P family protein [bacterium]
MIVERINQLRHLMRQHNIHAYIIPTADFHQSEYVGDYFQARKYFSGFTGSAGTLVVTMDKAGLWTDGRYYIQAERELDGSGIALFKSQEAGVLSIEEFLVNELEENSYVGFDGRVIAASFGKKLESVLAKKSIQVQYKEDLADAIWTDRPTLSEKSTFVLELKYAGEDAGDKIARIREQMACKQTNMHIVTSLDDIAWILNIRGDDVEYNPVVLSYLVITEKEICLFINEKKLTEQVKEHLDGLGVTIYGYNDIYNYVSQIEKDQAVLYDGNRINYTIVKNIPEGVRIVNAENPSVLMKAIKNDIEVDNLIQAHIKDGVAFTKFMYWVKQNIGKISMTEVTASDYLEECRKAQEGFIELSFDTICAYKDNAAMMHYSAKAEDCAELKKEGLLLIDSGGQYYEGTTDITRTLALGPVCEEQRHHFTAVVNSMLNLANARFLHGCTGLNLDILARGPIWNLDLDYRCGTGHGVGYLLNVHESPNGFRWKAAANRSESAVLEEGMVTTDEPGVYIEGSHGIRIENELVCRKGTKNEYGQFMYFENITMAPIDLDALDITLMSSVEKARLNVYHKKVYEILLPYMSIDEAVWLKEYTREI